MENSKLKCASFFAGVGGIELGFDLAGFETVYANEFDPYAAETYRLNFPDVKFDPRDIREVKPEEIPPFDVLLAGFPCQAFSVAGYRKGFDDEKGRGNLFFELKRIIEARRPRVAFFENVKNLVGHDNGNTFRVICKTLEDLGYKHEEQVLNACQYGNVPQNRERIYIVAFRDDEDKKNFEMPQPVTLDRTIRDVIDFERPASDKYYYKREKCCFYDKLEEAMKNPETIYQWRRKYVRENKSNVVPTLTANMGEGGHNVPLILANDGRIRKLTPRECFNVQGYPESFKLPEQADCRLYKQAGNSVVVPVIERIAKNVRMALERTDSYADGTDIKLTKVQTDFFLKLLEYLTRNEIDKLMKMISGRRKEEAVFEEFVASTTSQIEKQLEEK